MLLFESEILSRPKAWQVKQWDDEIRNYGGSEDIWGYWITYGVPDHIEDWNVDDYASQFNNADYEDFKRVYNQCKKMIEAEENGDYDDENEIINQRDYLDIKEIDGDITQYANSLPVVKETDDFIYGQSMYGHIFKVNKKTNEIYKIPYNGKEKDATKIGDTCRWYKW